MASQPLRIPAGVVIADTKATLLGRWNATNFVRWHNGRMQPVGGWARLTPSAFSGPVRAGHAWLDNQYRRNSIFMTDDKVYRERGSVFTEITPQGWTPASLHLYRRGYGSGEYGRGPYGQDTDASQTSPKFSSAFPVRYCFVNWGEQVLFMTSVDARVWVYNPADDSVALATGLPGTQIQDIIVTDERCLMLLGYGGMPNRVAWSQTEDRTNFNFTDVTGSAGFQDLDTAGNLITARRVQGGVLIFSSTAVYFATYVGQPYIYSIKRIAEGCAPISAQAVATFSGKAYWMGKGQFWTYDNGSVAPLPCDLGDDVFLNLANTRTVFASSNYAFPEIWFGYARTNNGPDDGENNAYAIYNFSDGWWANGSLRRSFMEGSAVDNAPLGGGVDGNVFLHERGWLDGGMSRIGNVWARATVSFDDAGGLATMGVGQVDSGNTDPASVQFDVVARVARNGKDYPKGPFIPRPDGKVTMRFTASDFDFKISGRVDGLWAFGAVIQDAQLRGSR